MRRYGHSSKRGFSRAKCADIEKRLRAAELKNRAAQLERDLETIERLTEEILDTLEDAGYRNLEEDLEIIENMCHGILDVSAGMRAEA